MTHCLRFLQTTFAKVPLTLLSPVLRWRKYLKSIFDMICNELNLFSILMIEIEPMYRVQQLQLNGEALPNKKK